MLCTLKAFNDKKYCKDVLGRDKVLGKVDPTSANETLQQDQASLTSNDASNAIILTDTQANIKRMAKIIQALDTSISGISTMHVFPLQYADAKELADVVLIAHQLVEVHIGRVVEALARGAEQEWVGI